MARIRTVKPEFWDSPSTARASAVARLAFIGMWNWADDFGRGTANPKELEGFIFPHDDLHELSGGKSRNFRDVMAEVSDCYGVIFYVVNGRPYYAIPSWDKHQRNERSAKAKHPGPDEADEPLTSANTVRIGSSAAPSRKSSELPIPSGAGTGEQGNRGTGEEPPSSPAAPPREDVESICTLLADLVESNGSKRPTITARWRTEARLLLDKDGRPLAEVERLIRWCQSDPFWRTNILSIPTFRDKYDQLRLKAQSNGQHLQAVGSPVELNPWRLR